ncbi:Chaperone protein dnaJ (fragment) [Bradyrhizobium sp. STM 3843]|uniref:hypothetical protein n=1 Tax=Bradyrhizobium sp. STM 3843 TaxID=551947 RepID=UPI000240323B
MAKPPELPRRKLCPTCGRSLAVREQADGRKELTCPTCDGPDPLHSPRAIGWTNSSLQPPKRPE